MIMIPNCPILPYLLTSKEQRLKNRKKTNFHKSVLIQNFANKAVYHFFYQGYLNQSNLLDEYELDGKGFDSLNCISCDYFKKNQS